MKQYLLLLRSSDFNKTGNVWTSNPINLYSNSQYKNYSYTRSQYGLNLVNDRIFVGTEITSPNFTGPHATPYSSNALYKTNVGEVIYEPATPSLKRFIDTTSRVDILTFKHTFTNLPGINVPTFTLVMYEADSANGPWLRSSVSSESNVIFIKNSKPFIKIELNIYSDGVDLSAVGLLFYLEIGIYDPISPVISSSVRNILKRFPSWTEIFEDSFEPATPGLAIPQSTGGKFLNAILQEGLDDFAKELDLNSINSHISSADESMIAWMYVSYNVPQNINTIFGDSIPLARVSTFADLMSGKSDDHTFYYNPVDRQFFTLRKFTYLTINSTLYTQEPINVFNDFDEFGARVGLPRLYLESNSNYKKRIIDVSNNLPGVSLDALKRTLRRELDIWRAYGATPNSDYLGATPDILEISDIETSTPYFTDSNLPTHLFRQLVEDINTRYPANFGYVNWEEGMWDYAGLKGEGVSRIPAIYDTTNSFGQYYQPGVGDFDDARVDIYPPDSQTIDFSGKIKISGFKAISKSDIYAPVIVDYSWFFNYTATVADYEASRVGTALVYEISLKAHDNYSTPSTFYVNLNYNNNSNFYVGNRLFPTSSASPEYSLIPIFDVSGMSLAELEFRDKVYNQRYYNRTRGNGASNINIKDAASINVIFGRTWASPSYQSISTGSYKASFSRATPSWVVSPTAGSNISLSTPSGVISPADANIYIGSNVYATKQQSFFTDSYTNNFALNTPNIDGLGGVSNYRISTSDLYRRTVFAHAKATPQFLYITPNTQNAYPLFGSEFSYTAPGGYGVNPYDDETYIVPASPNILWRPFNSAGIQTASPQYFQSATVNYSTTPSFIEIYTKDSAYYPFERTNYEYFEAETDSDIYSGFVDETNRIFKNQEEYNNSFLLEDKFLETISLSRTSFGLAATPRYVVDYVKFQTEPSAIDAYVNNTQSLIDKLNTAFANDVENVSWKDTPLSDAVFYIDANNASFNAQLVDNLGTGGSILNAQAGTTSYVNTAHIKNGALNLPGVASNYASTFDYAAADISGNIEIVCRVNLVNWAVQNTLISKYNGFNLASYLFFLETGGYLNLNYGLQSDSGQTRTSGTSPITSILKNNTTYWLKVTRIASTGVTSFFYAPDQEFEPANWIQIPTTTTGAAGNLFVSTYNVQIGAFGSTGANYPMNGKFYRGIIRNGINGNAVYDIDFTKQADWTIDCVEDSVNKNIVTVLTTNPINVDPTLITVEDSGFFYQPSTTSAVNGVSIPSAIGSTTDITGNLAIAVQIRPFETNVDKPLLMKRQFNVDSNNFPYFFGMTNPSSGPTLKFIYTSSSGTQGTVTGTIRHNVPIGKKIWFGVTFAINNTTFQNTTNFYTSEDGISWNLFESQTNANPGGIALTLRSNAAWIGIGATNTGTAGPEGKYYRAKIWNTNSFAGTPVLDVNFDKIVTGGQTSIIAETGQIATFNRHTTGRKIVTMPSKANGGRSVWTLGSDTGAADVFLVPNNDLLNFGARDSFTVMGVVRAHLNNADQRILGKYDGTSGYLLGKTSAPTHSFGIYDGTSSVSGSATYTNGILYLVTGVRDINKDIISTYSNVTQGTIVTDVTTGSLSNTQSLAIGAQIFNASGYADMELGAVAIWRRALTDQEIKQVKDYLIDQVITTSNEIVDVDIYANYDEVRANQYRLGMHTGWLDIEESEQYVYAEPESATYNGKFFELTLNDSPRKGAPIIVDVDGKQYRNVVFEDLATPGYASFYNTETVVGGRNNSLYLAYQNIKNGSITDTYTGKKLFSNLSSASNIFSPFSSATPVVYGREYDVVYYVNDAFYVENDVYDSSIDDYRSKIYFSSTPSVNSNYYITYEKAYKKDFIDTELSLSQVDSPINEGFIYISKDEFSFSYVEAYLSPAYITDSLDDLMYLTIISYDSNGNLKPEQTFSITGTSVTAETQYITTNKNGIAKVIIRYSGSIPATDKAGIITISGVDNTIQNINFSPNSQTNLYSKTINFDIIRSKNFDLKIKATATKLTASINGRTNIPIVGQVYWKDKPLKSKMNLRFNKARSLYDLFNNPSYIYTTTDSNGYFNLSELTFIIATEISTPGIWFVSIELAETAEAIQGKLLDQGEVVNVSDITISGDIVYWNEKYGDNLWDIEEKPLPYWFISSIQANSELISTPNFVYSHHNAIDVVVNNSTPNWIPPVWVPIRKFDQYQMRLFGSTPNYISNYTDIHPDFGEE